LGSGYEACYHAVACAYGGKLFYFGDRCGKRSVIAGKDGALVAEVYYDIFRTAFLSSAAAIAALSRLSTLKAEYIEMKLFDIIKLEGARVYNYLCPLCFQLFEHIFLCLRHLHPRVSFP